MMAEYLAMRKDSQSAVTWAAASAQLTAAQSAVQMEWHSERPMAQMLVHEMGLKWAPPREQQSELRWERTTAHPSEQMLALSKAKNWVWMKDMSLADSKV